MKTISTNKSHGGTQGVYSHASSSCNCDMTFAVFVPPQAADKLCPVLWYLSGLTCSHANVMDKGEYRKAATKHGIIIVCPDTSPRGENVPDDGDNWQFGSGAGFYVDATEQPWRKNYQMYSYITQELPSVIAEQFNTDMSRQSIFGHSMGGHGALTIALKNPDRYKSCSAFAPIAQPSTAGWSASALARYLGEDQAKWRNYDASLLIEDGHTFSPILVDQGTGDDFLKEGLRPWLLEEACQGKDIDLTLRMQDGYDHSYFFISTFMDEHIEWHAKFLNT
jgi:S-formylglutathione hydrolase